MLTTFHQAALLCPGPGFLQPLSSSGWLCGEFLLTGLSPEQKEFSSALAPPVWLPAKLAESPLGLLGAAPLPLKAGGLWPRAGCCSWVPRGPVHGTP